MHCITVINAKGGCGKSTIAMNLSAGLAHAGYKTLLIDMDPQAQVTQWLGLGDGLTAERTLVMVMAGQLDLAETIQNTAVPNLSFVSSAEELEHLGRRITEQENYHLLFTKALGSVAGQFDFVVLDSPNQISPIMENAIFPADLFIVPFESTKAVKSYGNVFKLILNLRGDEPLTLHVLSNISLRGVRNRVAYLMAADGIPTANTEIRPCGWLAQVDEHGGSIFDYRPKSKGARDFARLREEVLRGLGYCIPGTVSRGAAAIINSQQFTMSETPQQRPSRMAIIREQAVKGELGMATFTTTGRKVLSLEKLVEDPENERKTFDDMDDLVASVKAHGVVEPCTVIDLGDGRYQIVTGHRRYRAALLAGLEQIEVLIRAPEEKWERRKKSLVSNVQRADVRAIELAESLKLLLANDPAIKNQEDLAKAIGKGKAWVSKVLRILDLPETLREKVSTSKLLIPHDALSEIARLTDHKKQGELVEALVNGATMRDIRGEISIHKGKAPAPKEALSTPKPKWVFHTQHGADIIVQSKRARLSLEERIAALQEALEQANVNHSILSRFEAI